VDNAELIRFVAVQPMDDRVPEDEKADVRQRTPGKHLASLYLPPAPGLPECVANLDIEFSLPRSALGTDGSFFSNRKKRWEPILVPFEDLISSRVASLDATKPEPAPLPGQPVNAGDPEKGHEPKN